MSAFFLPYAISLLLFILLHFVTKLGEKLTCFSSHDCIRLVDSLMVDYPLFRQVDSQGVAFAILYLQSC